MTRRTAYPLPAEILEGDIAILGRKGGGKTVTGKGLVEQLLEAKARVLVLDVLGVWAGLRTSADGRKPGYPVAIFGGEHGDLPLDPAGATHLAGVLGAENLPAVIDLSDLSKAEQNRFVGGFLKELRRVNREALTLVLEEADVFAPQNPLGDDSKIVHAEVDWIARRGRSRGFRLITITQRPARLSKDVLTQASTLIVHKLPSPQDRDAVKAWVEGNGDRDQARAVFDSLAGLDVGEAWVYAPEHGMLQRVRFPLMRTLDTSSTPKAGETRIVQKTLAEVDVAALRQALTAATPDREVQTGSRRTADEADIAHRIEAATAAGYDKGVNHGFSMALQQLQVVQNTALDEFGVFMRKRLEGVQLQRPSPAGRKLLSDLQGPPSAPSKASQAPAPEADRPAIARAALATAEAGITRPQSELLAALRWWLDQGHGMPTRAQVAAVVGWKLKGSHLRNRLGELRTAGFIEFPSGGSLALTTAGIDVAPAGDAGGDLHTRLRATLTAPQRLVFDALLRQGGEMSRRALAAELRWEETGSHLRNRIGELKSMEIVNYPGNGRVALQKWVTGD